ncbi:hypothetical protein V6L77_17585 [Pannonibacter sp. Pt2-lr]
MLTLPALPVFAQTAVRNVSPPGVAIPEVTAPLQRIERARPQASGQTEASALPARNFHLVRPLVLEKAMLTSGKLTVELAYVTGLSAAETCQTASGQTWPCGARALTALRALLRSHRVDCQSVAPLGPRRISAACSRGQWTSGSGCCNRAGLRPVRMLPKAIPQLKQPPAVPGLANGAGRISSPCPRLCRSLPLQ